MKILQVIPRFNPALGGGVHVVYNLSKYMARRGHEVTILTTKYKFDEYYAKSLSKDGVKAIPFDYLFNFHLFIPSPKMKDWLSKNIHKYDIVHLNGARSYQNNLIYKYAKKYNIPYVLQAHGSMLRIVEIENLKLLYDLLWGHKLYKGASMAIALNDTEAEACKTMGINDEKIVIVPNGVDLSQFNILPKKGEFRKNYSISSDEKIILYLGRLHKSKKIDMLLKAFSILLKKLDNARLLLIGPNDGYKLSLEKLAKELKISKKILFTGPVSEDKKIKAFVDADVFVTPRFYGFPITFAEACACGLPIVTTDQGEYLDWIDKKVGFVVKPNINLLADAIFKVLSDEKLRREFSKNAQNLSRTRFNWSEISRKFEMVYIESI